MKVLQLDWQRETLLRQMMGAWERHLIKCRSEAKKRGHDLAETNADNELGVLNQMVAELVAQPEQEQV